MDEIVKFTEEEADICCFACRFPRKLRDARGLRFEEPFDFACRDVSVDTVSRYRAKARKALAYVMVFRD